MEKSENLMIKYLGACTCRYRVTPETFDAVMLPATGAGKAASATATGAGKAASATATGAGKAASASTAGNYGSIAL